MHYAVVQVSKHRHVVVQYAGTTTALHGDNPTFVTVSAPMKFSDAAELAKTLTAKRLRNKVTTTDDMTIDPADRAKYPHHTDDAIRGIKLIAAESDTDLEAVKDELMMDKYNGGPKFKALLARFGEKTNPNWLVSRVAEALYDRNLICGAELDTLTR
jgi:hypothetical protein